MWLGKDLICVLIMVKICVAYYDVLGFGCCGLELGYLGVL